MMKAAYEEVERVTEHLARIKGNSPADQGRRAATEDDIEDAEKKGDKKLVAKLKEDELDEGSMKNKLIKTADLIQKMIKPGDPDRHDFAAARDHIESNNMKTVKQIVMNMDTEPRERVVVAMAKGLGRAETEKILGVKLNMGEEVELDEEVSVKDFDALKKGDTVTVEYKSAMSSGKGTFAVTAKNKVAKGKVEKVTLKSTKNPGGVKYFLYKRDNKVGFAQGDMGASVVSFKKEEVELDEAKYELYHKDFSSAMQHAYKMAKKLHGITVKPSEIDDKVASGPRKPSEGKTNTYRLKGDKGAIQVQVYNKGGNKPYELNFYKENTILDRIDAKLKERKNG